MLCVYAASAASNWPSSASVIDAHPDFRMIVLANRPGFPFLGNDFFGAMGVYVARCIAHNLSQCNCHTVSLYKHNTDTLIYAETMQHCHCAGCQ